MKFEIIYYWWINLKFANLGSSWLTKFVGLIWNLNLGLNIYCEFYTFLDIYIWAIFVFVWAYSTILLAEYEFMTRGTRNFMKESETRKTIRRHWTCLSLFEYTFYFSSLFSFIFINFCKYLFVYICWVCTKLNIE